MDNTLSGVTRDQLQEMHIQVRGYTEQVPADRSAHPHTKSVDQTPEAAMSRLRLYFDDDAEELMKARVRFIK
jgi:hypothetical protein